MSLAVSLLLGLAASGLFALGLTLMKSRAATLPVVRRGFVARAIWAWIRDPIWSAGLLCQTVGYALFVYALTVAPISLVSCVMQGGIALFVLFAVVFLGERAQPREWVGISITIGGMLILALSLSAGEIQRPTDNRAMLLVTIMLTLAGLLPLRIRRLKENGIGAAIFSGVIFGLATLYTKAMANYLIAPGGVIAETLLNPYVYAVIAFNIVGMVALQNSFGAARGIIAMPLSSALSNILPIAGGVVVFGEYLPADSTAATMRVAAFVLTVIGSALLANAQEPETAEDLAAVADAARAGKQGAC